MGQAPADATELASIQSLPLTDVVHEMLTNSDNNTAELMVKEIGVSAAGTGTREAGLGVMATTLASWGLDVTGVVLADGSGLSLDNRITCPIMLEVLQRTGSTARSVKGSRLPADGHVGRRLHRVGRSPAGCAARPARSTTRRSTRIRRR
jgi:D-alanyl-D-alanine carboxypeptidase/D-alanyl-D-alanine-endopeptidase (penicillin-binding protein 4)